MYKISSEIYDLVYSYKDYEHEALLIQRLIQSFKSDAKTLLDFGCGTGRHHSYLVKHFSVDGVDLNEQFLQKASLLNPIGEYQVADMSCFKSGKRYDVITCLFSSIGYNTTLKKLHSTLCCFYDCLTENGVVFVEPWFTPEVWEVGKLQMLYFDQENLKVCRLNQSDVRGRVSITNFHYLVGASDDGICHLKEQHKLGLFTKNEMLESFVKAGFTVHYNEAGIAGRGLYCGVKTSGLPT